MIKNNSGFSLVESLVAVGLLAIVTGATAMIISESTKGLRTLEKDILDSTEDEIAERVLLRDIKLSEPSFNNIIMKDDRNNDFFDFVADAVDKVAIENTQRDYTLTLNGKNAFTMIVSDDLAGGGIFYDPVMAYNIGPEPADWDLAASLAFVSLNKNGYLQAQNPALWQAGRLLLLDTPIAIREMGANGPNYNISPRSPSFIGVVPTGNGALKKIVVPQMAGLFNTSHPIQTKKVISNEDIFLRSVPPAGGGAALVRLRPVRLVQYALEKDKDTAKINLVRKLWNGKNGVWETGQVIGTNISSAVFFRKATNNPLVYFQINRE